MKITTHKYILMFWRENPKAITGIEVGVEMFDTYEAAEPERDRLRMAEGFHARIEWKRV